MRTVVQALEDAAESTRTGYRFIEEGQSAEPFFTYSGVERATARYGGAMQAMGLQKGDRVALILPDNQDFVFAFLGALRAGIIPVPIYPPAGLRKLGGYLDSTLHVVEKSGAKVLVTDSDVKKLLGTVAARASSLREVASVEAIRKSKAPLTPVKVELDDTCFLQFTSGSTAAPKGVIVTHRNIAANVDAFMRSGLQVEAGVDSGVSWLPLYHDMGLIGFVLGPLYYRNTITFLPPLLFLKRPARWLETISRLRATISFGPNFAYALCVKRVRDKDMEGLDLSQWRAAGCGAEPIRAANLEAFADKFSAVGFDRRALLPCYGMAEATLAVSFDGLGEGVRADRVDGDELAAEGKAVEAEPDKVGALEIVNCGRAFEGHDIAIFAVDDDASATPLPDRVVGEIRVKGPSITTGYFEEPELTRQAFAGDWLRTGDLGYLVGGELFICGRQKELIIVNGRNYYPQDLEWEASRVQGVRKGNVIAFGTRKPLNDRERVVIAFETSQDASSRERLKEEVRKAVRNASGLSIDDVVALDAGVLPKTSSGKLKRNETRRLYETGQLFQRTSARQGDVWETAKELAKSQLGYVKSRLARDKS
ncbi:MAG: fatty acyl-AMP ligase [Myxococcales bacterium]|nr:fatty acyl-AMP ligase [Myxococcales bacterium]